MAEEGHVETLKRILVVDDDPNIVEAVGLALESAGYAVMVARDGVEGLMRAERDHPDLILLDVVMPRRSGFTVLSRLHQGGHSSPIIMMSGTIDDSHREFAESRGVRAIVPKPFEVDQLVAEVNAVMADYRATA